MNKEHSLRKPCADCPKDILWACIKGPDFCCDKFATWLKETKRE